MSFKIAIASGKGGTGKTTVSVTLFHLMNLMKKKVQLIDCDVEEPNDLIFFPEAQKTNETEVNQLIPQIHADKCSYCRKCASWCEFNAITIIPPVKFAEVNAGLCHSCGACLVACPEDAMIEIPHSTGKITEYIIPGGHSIAEGRLKTGSSMQTMLIRQLKKQNNGSRNIIIYDAPPGTSCPVVETISNTNYIILVAEPTPFGLHDLKLMIALLSEIKIPFGVIINKAGMGNNELHTFLSENNIELLGEIPFIKKYATNYASGDLFKQIPLEVSQVYMQLIEKLEQKILLHEGDHCIKR